MKLRTLLFITICLIFSQSLFAQSSNALRQKSFEQVWSTVNEKHFDPTFGGVDWKKIGETYKPKALQAKTDDEFHAVLRQMLGELKLSHFGVFPTQTEIKADDIEGKSGFEIKIFENKPIVNKILASSEAEKNRLKIEQYPDDEDFK
nr:hypothetical protein [Pyrinomonadaceae bacterium]